MPPAEIFDSLAALLQYPDETFAGRAEACRRALQNENPEIRALLESFHLGGSRLSIQDRQELFTQTFDLNPVCSLEVGWHLFGEQYERGEFLVKMRQQLRRFGLQESSELPDHLAHVLGVLGRMEPEEADEFAGACVFPALDKMRSGLQGKDNLYDTVLEMIVRVMESRYERPAAVLTRTPLLRVIEKRRPA